MCQENPRPILLMVRGSPLPHPLVPVVFSVPSLCFSVEFLYCSQTCKSASSGGGDVIRVSAEEAEKMSRGGDKNV